MGAHEQISPQVAKQDEPTLAIGLYFFNVNNWLYSSDTFLKVVSLYSMHFLKIHYKYLYRIHFTVFILLFHFSVFLVRKCLRMAAEYFGTVYSSCSNKQGVQRSKRKHRAQKWHILKMINICLVLQHLSSI